MGDEKETGAVAESSNEDIDLDLDDEEDPSKKAGQNIRRCSKCKRLTCGHEGPYGPKCVLSILSSDELKDDDIKKLQNKANKNLENEEEINKKNEEAKTEEEKLKKSLEEK